MSKEFDKALSKARIALLAMDKVVFFSSLVMGTKHIEDTSVQTAQTNGEEIFYNPEWFLKLKPEERPGLILHETMHVVLEHCTSRAAGMDPEIWNKAADYVINQIIVDAGIKLPEGGLLDPKYKNMSTNQVYQLIFDEQQKNGGQGDGKQNMAGGQAMSDIGDPKRNPGQSQEEAKQQIRQKVEETVMNAKSAAEMAGQEPGKCGADLERLFNEMTKPAIPWQRLLQRFLNALNKFDYSMKKPNKRYIDQELYLPSLYSPGLGRIDFAVDTSGSITDEIFNYFISEIHHVLKRFQPDGVGVMQFHHYMTANDYVKNTRELLKLKMIGRGGTDVSECVEAFSKNQAQALFILTDGYLNTDLPNPGKPVIWCIYDRKHEFKPAWGEVVNFKLPGDL
ncbi:hypothetical protein MIF8_4 [Erwinia phage MIF8]